MFRKFFLLLGQISGLCYFEVQAASAIEAIHEWSRDFENFSADSKEEKGQANYLGKTLKALAEHDGHQIRNYVAKRPAGDTQNIAIIKVIEVDGAHYPSLFKLRKLTKSLERR